MNNVNDLTKTSVNQTPTQTVSLSSITGEGITTPSKPTINSVSVGEVTSKQENAQPKPVVRINPNIKKASRRTVTDPSSVVQVDPNEFIEKPEMPRPKRPQDIAMTDLDRAVTRKQKEFHDFIEKATEEDAVNRERVEAGLEKVEGEMQYMPNELHTPMKVEDEVKPMSTSEFHENFDEDFEDLNDEVEYSSNIEEELEATPANKVTFSDPFGNIIDEPEQMEPGMKMTIEEKNGNISEYECAENSNEYANEEISDIKEEAIIEEENEEANIDEKIQDTINFGSINITSTVLEDKATVENSSSSDFDMDDEDFEDLNTVTYDNNDENLSNEEIQKISDASEKHLKAEILQKIIQAGKTLDTSQFVVSTKVINIKDAIGSSEKKPVRTGSWPLTYAGRPFISSALKGPEIALLADADDSDSNSSVGLTIPQARIMFEHDANPYRPATLEAWSKTIPFLDIDNIFAAMYVASMKGANYIPNVCPKAACQYSYLSDDIDINKMVKFANDESKERFEKIKNVKLTPENTGAYDSVVSVINDRFAVGLKIPSIFTILYELGSLDRDFVNKYSTAVSIIQYVDYIYLIDPDEGQYKPIGWKTYGADYTKTFKSKIATYSKILKEFDDTEFSVLVALISSMVTKATESKGISFEVPETKCPKCGAVIEARPMAPRMLVFMRQRLVELATTPTER